MGAGAGLVDAAGEHSRTGRGDMGDVLGVARLHRAGTGDDGHRGATEAHVADADGVLGVLTRGDGKEWRGGHGVGCSLRSRWSAGPEGGPFGSGAGPIIRGSASPGGALPLTRAYAPPAVGLAR